MSPFSERAEARDRARAGAFPGTFNPPTVAHLAIAEAARAAHDLERIDLVLSRAPIGKEHVVVPPFEDRLTVLARIAERFDWLHVVVTDHRLIVDIASGYDLVIMGADKWQQVNDPQFYDGSPQQRDAALRRLPAVALFEREGFDVEATVELDPALRGVSSTLAREGAHHLMAPEARTSGLWG